MGEFNSNNHYIYYSGQKSLRRNGVALIVNKRVQNAVLGYNLKTNRMILVHFQGKPFNITVICSNHWCQRSWSWPILWRPTTPSRTNTPKRCPFHHRGLEWKSRKLRDIWSNRQVWPWSTKWSRAKANRVLPKEHTSHSKHPFPIRQEMTLHMDTTRWSILKSAWSYSLQLKTEKLYTVSKIKTRSWQWLRSWTPYCKIQA